MPQKSKGWLQAYNDIKAEDQIQSRLIDLLDDSIHSSQKDLIGNRADSLTKLISDMDLESALRLNYRFNNKRDPLNELVTLELSDSLAARLRRITARKAETGDRFISSSQRGTTSTATIPTSVVPPPQKPVPPKSSLKPLIAPPATKQPVPAKTTKRPRQDPKIIYPDPNPNDPFSWITQGLSAQEVIARTAVQMGIATGMGIFVLAEWILTDALQIAANFILHRLGSTVPKMVGNAGEQATYFILRELIPTNLRVFDLNAIATDFPVFDYYTPSEGFISVKTYGILSKTRDLKAYAKKMIKSDFKKLFETDYIDKAMDKILSKGQSLPVPKDSGALEEYLVKNFKFCVPYDQVPGAIEAFSEYISLNTNDFPDLHGLDPKTNPTGYTTKVKEIAGSHVMGFPISTSTLRDLYNIANRLGDIKQVLKSKNRNDLDWYTP